MLVRTVKAGLMMETWVAGKASGRSTGGGKAPLVLGKVGVTKVATVSSN